MANTKDPYIGLLDVMRTSAQEGKGNTSGALVGSVISASPLQVQVSGILLEGDDMLVNDMLLSGYGRSASLGEASGTLSLGTGLHSGDQVLLIPGPDMQQFYLVSVLKAVT